MLLFYLLLILITAVIANVQLHKWKRQRRLDLRAAAATKKKPAPRKRAREEIDLDQIDWDGLDQDDLDLTPPATPEPAPAKDPVTRPAAGPVNVPADEFSALERALPQGQLTAAQRDEAMKQLLKANLHIPVPEPGERHVVLDMDGGSYVPVATHPAAAGIALGYLAEGMKSCRGEQLLRELRGGDVGVLVVARNPQKPAVARLWKIQPEDL
ncbi:hypothetical protein NK553_07545 [Pseudomonas sp. ZM23]|uniref:Uncharacterized protein n=1 Tax=Pseudomonas triclosanedens TaxID=2961893 RepID=A0ABY7A3H9_9PSED|nr:hypothetical protein [Pseudomonas triclosanedens]MCP8463797.1 hypothetical protein [Pseudomonas triclosanedens]MCP8468881.1 hypothetical protein [Pseudomonas triclosanedens]MCP8475603.1 hypothetical protein [Pseudomonas triclosanedens]WAI50679.1 hypothetical protein OU419_05305 [Pseudomonas triclosanedens]